MPEPDHKGADRFSSMAHLFLSDLRPAPKEPDGNGKTPPVRRSGPPRDNVPANPPPVDEREPDSLEDDPEMQEIAEPEDPSKKPHVIGVYGHHLGTQAAGARDQFARSLADSGKMVAVLVLEANATRLALYYRKSDPPPGLAGGILDSLKALADGLDYLLILCGPDCPQADSEILPLLDSRCVLASPDPQRLVGTYQLLKALPPGPLGIFVAHVAGYAVARTVHAKLEQTARAFGGRTIENFGFSLPAENVAQALAGQAEWQEASPQWLAELAEWLRSRRATEPVTVLADPEPPQPRTRLAEQEEPSVPERPVSREKSSAAADDDLVWIEPATANEPLADRVGQALVPSGRKANDSLTDFLRSAGLDCVKFQDSQGRGVLVLVLSADSDPSVAAWAVEHYPTRQDRLILVTDVPMGRLEMSRWSKQFCDLHVKRMLRGRLHGRSAVLIQK